MDLRGQKALVTGGASGIGAGIASGLRQAGADVIVADRSPPTADGLDGMAPCSSM